MRNRRTFSKEFKAEAVRLLETSDKPASELARELDIPRNRLYKWKEQIDKHGAKAFPGKGRRSSNEIDEVQQLRRELARVKEENEILKKAAAYFAKELP